ncbi:MAG: phosphate/phosphite/phosphonate ABC transporter substrate-binding protein [Bdellovibrionaceae bacterium]|jgi:phosphonate transport system substrate-binding protein|nr:phosphate/phosphite/phosphonate ABC transporter substrate-binding protein [Pseudobdellovibrionaceae bacterium]
MLKILLALPLLIAMGCTKNKAALGTAENPVKFFFVPSVDAKLLVEKTKFIHKYLEKHTPYKFKISVPTSYVAVVEAFGTNRADIASLNTFGYILANQKYKTEALLTVERFGHYDYKGQIIARTDSGINKIEDIQGKKIAYVDPASTSGYMLPATLLKERKIKPSQKVFAQRHDNVVTMVRQKQVDVGATFYSPKEDGKLQDARRLVLTQYPEIEKEVKIIHLTDPIPNDPIVFRKGMPDAIKKDVQAALLNYLNSKEGKAIFHELYGVTGLKKSTDKDYDGVRAILTALGRSASDLIKKKK